MSSITIVPGTGSTSLVQRLLFLLRLVPAAESFRPDPARRAGSAGEVAHGGEDAIGHSIALDPLDDLRNATWEDAEWQ